MIAKIGHRGSPAHVAENTLASFAFAFAQGADAVELDVQMSKDGYAVVMHDDDVDRTTNAVGLVADYTLAELKELKISGEGVSEGEKIPLLIDVLQEFAGIEGRKIYIEVKHGVDAQQVAGLVQKCVAEGGWGYPQLVMISFDVAIVDAVRKIDAQIPLGLTFEDDVSDMEIVELLKREQVEYINLNIKVVNAKLVKEIHRLGARVNVWTVNDASGVKTCVDAQVDGIMGDDICC